MFNRQKSFRRYIYALPWLNEGFQVDLSPRKAFLLLSHGFSEAGFRNAASDERMMRLVAYRTTRHEGADCSCIHVLWVRQQGSATYISYGLAPRFGLFFLCKWRSHLYDLKVFGWFLRSALEQ